jgi:bla regulator protein blaR1
MAADCLCRSVRIAGEPRLAYQGGFFSGVFGAGSVWRASAVLLLPDGILEQLTPEQWRGVVAHEFCHVRHRDNLAGAVQMFVEALFWFHPLAWWVGRRIGHERERACDEEVLQMGGEPRIYAQGILKVCELYLESPVACVAGISGANLRKRIEAIMHYRAARNLSWGGRALIGCGAAAALATPLVVGMFGAMSVRAQGPDWQKAAGGKMAFEVASVKPSTAFRPPNFPFDPGDAKTAGGRLSAVFPAYAFIEFAYKVGADELGDVSKAFPKSFPMDRSFEIEARAAGNPTKDQMRLMMQTLLADRFKLKVHFETREGPVLALTLVRPGRLGPKLRPHADGPPCPAEFEMRGAPNPKDVNPKDVFPFVCGYPQMWGTNYGGRNVTMEIIAEEAVHGMGSMMGEIDKPVIDQTGLKGRYDFTLDLPPGAMHIVARAAPPTPDAPLPDPTGTPLISALRTQLGLKLVSTKGPIRKLVIDHIERPSAN